MAGGIYGRTFKNRLRYLDKCFGEEGVKKVIRAMHEKGYDGPTETVLITDSEVLPISYNDVLLQAIKELYGENRIDSMARSIAYGRGIQGIDPKYQTDLASTTHFTAMYWSDFWTSGKLKDTLNDPGKLELELSDFDGSELMCRYLTNYFRGVADATDTIGFEIDHTRCVHRGDGSCYWTATYDK